MLRRPVFRLAVASLGPAGALTCACANAFADFAALNNDADAFADAAERDDNTDAFAQSAAEYDEDAPPVSMQDLYDAVSCCGSWVDTEWGQAWKPHVGLVGDDFVPFASAGTWFWTDLGWAFESDHEWGWAAFHYGRWAWSPTWGWVWFPDLAWSAAAVTWRSDGEYVGWAPLPPARLRPVVVVQWCVVPARRFCDHDPARHRRPDAEPPRAAPSPPPPPPHRGSTATPTPPSWRGHPPPPRAVRFHGADGIVPSAGTAVTPGRRRFQAGNTGQAAIAPPAAASSFSPAPGFEPDRGRAASHPTGGSPVGPRRAASPSSPATPPPSLPEATHPAHGGTAAAGRVPAAAAPAPPPTRTDPPLPQSPRASRTRP